ncbi:MAG TPA: hypothetical protein VLC91_13655 [Spongiibacteraceae bacterium]|nr:hypothetical protein [Spongiibacteraceae bacterium]
MRHAILMCCFLATAAHAVDSVTVVTTVDSGGEGVCKVAVERVGEAMPAGNYQGQCANGKPEGIGEVTFNNGDRFNGEFKNGRIDGKGTWTSGTSGNTYTGNWRNGRRAGEGTYNWAHGTQQYVGEWADDKRQGQGTFTWANGDRFEGEFRNNQQYTGTFYTAGGKVHTCYMGLCR